MTIFFFSCAGFLGHVHEIFLVNVPQFNYVLIVIKLTALFVQEDNINNFALWNYSHRLLNYLISNPYIHSYIQLKKPIEGEAVNDYFWSCDFSSRLCNSGSLHLIRHTGSILQTFGPLCPFVVA